MAFNYEQLFHDLTEQIVQVSPKTAYALEYLKAECGAQAAYYAVFIFICLEAQRETVYTHPTVTSLTSEHLRSFTFFEFTQENPRALALFEQALQCYKHDLLNGQNGAGD